jgi:hypothetical protein
MFPAPALMAEIVRSLSVSLGKLEVLMRNSYDEVHLDEYTE